MSEPPRKFNQKETTHPFAFHTLTWLHNGHVWGFEKFREALIATAEKLLPLVAGDTDRNWPGPCLLASRGVSLSEDV